MGYSIPYFSKNKLLTKDNIIQQFIGDQQLLEYLPDKLNKSTLTGEFLLTLPFNVKKEKYLYLYNLYKNQKINRTYFHGKIYEVNIKKDFANNLGNYIKMSK